MILVISTFCKYAGDDGLVTVMSHSCDPIDYRLPGFSVHGISQTKILEWLPFCSPGDLHDPVIELGSFALKADLPTQSPGKPLCDCMLSSFASRTT